MQFLGDVAVVTDHLRDIPPLPITSPTTFARRSVVLRLERGQWLIVHHHASNFAWSPLES